MIREPINYENASVNLPGINQSLLILEVMPGTFPPAFFENAMTNYWCQCASVLSHLKVLQFRFTYERRPNHCLKNLSNFIVFSHIHTPSDSNFQSKSNCYIFVAGVPVCRALQTKWFWNHCLINVSNLIRFSHIYTPLESNFQS